ncbi:hypothetical protein BJI47_02160 [Rhodococcus sp. 1168]|nr:hypothetical protein BJI47_02160 [Rhodococcus sp. 1168]
MRYPSVLLWSIAVVAFEPQPRFVHDVFVLGDYPCRSSFSATTKIHMKLLVKLSPQCQWPTRGRPIPILPSLHLSLRIGPICQFRLN